jgi:hypothetical protein
MGNDVEALMCRHLVREFDGFRMDRDRFIAARKAISALGLRAQIGLSAGPARKIPQ